jgi:hypothetical protein
MKGKWGQKVGNGGELSLSDFDNALQKICIISCFSQDFMRLSSNKFHEQDVKVFQI